MGKGLLKTIVITFLACSITVAAFTVIGFQIGQKYAKQSTEVGYEIETKFIHADNYVTLDQRVSEWEFEKIMREYEETYYSLDETTFVLILEKLGSSVSLSDVVDEYNANKAYYLTKTSVRIVDDFVEKNSLRVAKKPIVEDSTDTNQDVESENQED